MQNQRQEARDQQQCMLVVDVFIRKVVKRITFMIGVKPVCIWMICSLNWISKLGS